MRDETRFQTIMALVSKQVRHAIDLFETRRLEIGVIGAMAELAQVVAINEALLTERINAEGYPELREVICAACWPLVSVVMDFERANDKLTKNPDGSFTYVPGMDPAYVLTPEEEEWFGRNGL